MDPGDELVLVEGLGQIVVRAVPEPFHLAFRLAPAMRLASAAPFMALAAGRQRVLLHHLGERLEPCRKAEPLEARRHARQRLGFNRIRGNRGRCAKFLHGNRIQEIAFGGLAKATLRRLASLAAGFESDGRIAPPAQPRIKPGARLVREWHGRTHAVVVTEDGFEFEGKLYRSLTSIAREITGAGWSGPRFFGLTKAADASGGTEFPLCKSDLDGGRVGDQSQCVEAWDA